MASSLEFTLEGEGQTLATGRALATQAEGGLVIYLHGDLGAGKTTLVRGFLQALGHVGAVKSPTYALVEHYALAGHRVYHFDLYRLGDPEELEFMGLRDYFDRDAICLIEWPERGGRILPRPDLDLFLKYEDAGWRRLQIHALTARGERILRDFEPKTGLNTA